MLQKQRGITLFLISTCIAIFISNIIHAQTIYFNNFDAPNPLSGWQIESSTTAITWQADNTPWPGYSPSNCLNYNNGTDYASGEPNWGIATSPLITIPSTSSLPKLKFWCNYQTDSIRGEHDKRILYVLDDMTLQVRKSVQFSSDTTGPPYCQPGAWHQHIIYLHKTWGNIRIRFVLEADGSFDNFAGWFIDDMEVVDEPIPPGGSPLPYQQDFNTPPADWTYINTSPTVIWSADTTPAILYDGSSNLNYNDNIDYDDGTANAGEAISPALNISSTTLPVLKFYCNYFTESLTTASDKRFVQIINAQTTEVITQWQLATTAIPPARCALQGTWHQHVFYLDSSWTSIKIRFLFQADDTNNAYQGWFIDNLEVVDEPIASAGIAAPYFNYFESATPLDGWTIFNSSPPVVWAVDSSPSIAGGAYYSPTNSLNYNNDTDYSEGTANYGLATSPVLNISASTDPKLWIRCNHETETTGTWYDIRSILVLHPSSEQVLTSIQLSQADPYPQRCQPTGTWHQHAIFLDPNWQAVRIRLVFEADDTLNSTAGWFVDDFRVIGEIPVTLLSPLNGSSTNNASLSFDWTDAVVANPPVTYNIQIDESTDFSSPLNFEGLTSSNFTLPLPIADDTYYWRVRWKDDLGNWGPWSQVWSFTIDTIPPPPPILVSPVNTSSTNNASPVFDWQDVIDMTTLTYWIQVSTNPFFTPTVINATSSISQYTPSAPLADGTYYWHVKATDAATNEGNWSLTWSFTVDTIPPDTPTLLSPPNGTITNNNQPAFDWTDISDAYYYLFQIDDDPLFGSPLQDTPNVSSYIPPPLADGVYWWRVRAYDIATNASSWTPAWQITIDTTSPNPPTLLSPANNATVDTNVVTFDWTDVGDAVAYLFQLDQDSSFTSPLVYDVWLTGSPPPSQFTSGTLSNADYWWRVLAKDAAGNLSSWSAVWKVTVAGLVVGALDVSLGPNSPPDSNQLNTAQNVVMLQIMATANAVEDIKITKIAVTASGSGDDQANLSSVRLYRDLNGNGIIDAGIDTLVKELGAFPADNGTLIFDGLNEIIPAGQIRYWIIVYNFNGTAPIGVTFQSHIATMTDIEAWGQSSGQLILPNGLFPLSGGIVTIVAGGAGSITITKGPNSPADGFIVASEQLVEMLQMQLSVTSIESIQVNILTIHSSGTGNDNLDISEVFLARDTNANGIFDIGTDVIIASTGPYTIDNGSLTFSGLGQIIPAGQTQYWLVVYNMSGAGSNDSTYTLWLEPSTDASAEGLTSGATITPSGTLINGAVKTIGTAGAPGVVGSLTVSGLLFEPEQAEVPAYAHNVVMLKMQLTAGSVEDVAINQIRVKASGSGNDAKDVSRITIAEDVNGNMVFDPDVDYVVVVKDAPFGINDGQAVLSGFVWVIPANETRVWFVLYNFSGMGAEGGDFKASVTPPTDIIAFGTVSLLPITPSGATIEGPVVKVGPLVGSSGRERKKACSARLSYSRIVSWWIILLIFGCILLKFWKKK